MPKRTMLTALDKFVAIHNRCIDLTRTCQAPFKRPPRVRGRYPRPPGSVSPIVKGSVRRDVLRAAVVLSVSAMDAYFTDRFCELFIPALKRKEPGEAMVKLLKAAKFDIREALHLIQMQQPYRRIRKLIDDHLERHPTQRIDAINDLYRCFGLQNFCGNVEAKIGKKGLLMKVEKLVQRRHAIVHDGDYYHGKLQRISPVTSLEGMAAVMRFVLEAEKMLQSTLGLIKDGGPLAADK